MGACKMNTIILSMLKRIDPKWIPAITAGIAIIGSIIYLVYCKKRAEKLNAKLKVKLALAESDALTPLIDESKGRSKKEEIKATQLSKDIASLKDELKVIKTKSTRSRAKVMNATSWEDLNL